MQQSHKILLTKFPVLQFFNIQNVVSQEAIHNLISEIHLPKSKMSAQSKEALRMVRKFTNQAEQKFKKGRKLYKLLGKKMEMLDEIILNNKKIESIEALGGQYLPQLTELQLNSNQFDDLQPLSRLNAPLITHLDLSFNRISDVFHLQEVYWPRLQIINLKQNRIQSIENLQLNHFLNIKIIDISSNFIVSIRSLRKQIRPQMNSFRCLNLSNNLILDLSPLAQAYFFGLNRLYLDQNSYSSFQKIEKIQMGQGLGRSEQEEIKVSSEWMRGKDYIYKLKSLSRHKLKLKIDTKQTKCSRIGVQISRKLILD